MKQALIGLLVVAGLSIASNGQSTPASLALGQPIPDFTLKDLGGKQHSLKDYRSQIAVIVFVSTECPFSNAYVERLRAIASDYSKKNVALVGVNANPAESLAQIREHARQNKLDFIILKDEGSRVADAYGATRTPEVFVVDGSGVLRYRGRIDNSKEIARVQRHDLREALDEMIAGKPVSVAETKSFGCPIKMVRKNQAASGGRRSGVEEAVFVQASYSPGFANSFVPQKRPAPKTVVAKKPAARAATPNVALLKPEDFNKFKDAANGQVLVINFWATWCGPCIAEFPEFVALDKKYRAKGVKVVGISADEVTDIKRKVIPFIRRQKVQFDIVVQDTDDPQQMIDAVYKEWAGELPATFIYDKQGNLSYKHLGIINRDELVAEIEKALK
jgi:peroxiredoxin